MSSPNFMVCGFGRMAPLQPARRGKTSDSVCARAVTQQDNGGQGDVRVRVKGKGAGRRSAGAARY